jgi:DNA polymerase I-like protein with 3'-5' exonuclease and polymerase domains
MGKLQFPIQHKILRDKKTSDDYNYLIVFEKEAYESILKQAYAATSPTAGFAMVEHFRAISTSARIRRFLEFIVEQDYDRVLMVGKFVSSKILGKRFTTLQTAHGALYELETSGIIVVPTSDSSAYHSKKARKRDIYRWANTPYTTLQQGIDFTQVFKIPETLEAIYDTVFIDIETVDANGEPTEKALDVLTNQISSIQVAFGNSPVWYLNWPTLMDLENLYIHCVGKIVVVHNATFDISVLTRASQKRWYELHIQDTMLMAKSRGGETVNLKHLTTMLTDHANPLAYQTAHHSYNLAYAVADVLATREIYQYFLTRGVLPIDELNSKALKACIKAKLHGIRLDRQVLLEQQSTIDDDMETLSREICSLASVAPNTYDFGKPSDKVDLLLAAKVPLTEKTASGKTYTVSQQVLKPLAEKYPIVEKLLAYQELRTYLDHFLTPYINQKAKFVHPLIRLMGASSGRTACADPNIQNVPSRIKYALISRFDKGHIAYFDLVASEMRVVAMASGDEQFCEALVNYDIHSLVASKAFNIPYETLIKDKSNKYRKVAKTVGFGLLYGGSAKGLSYTSGASVEDVENVIEAIFEQFPKLKAYLEYSAKSAVMNGKSEDIYGKIRNYADLKAMGKYKDIERKGKNTPIQAMSAYICLELFSYIHSAIEEHKLNSIPVMQIHDSIYIDMLDEEFDSVLGICRDAFANLKHTPLAKLPGWGMVPIEGEFLVTNTFYNKDADIVEVLSSQNERPF